MNETLWDILLLFGRLGVVAFGSGSSILSEMDREVVARGWLDHTQFVQAFAVSSSMACTRWATLTSRAPT